MAIREADSIFSMRMGVMSELLKELSRHFY
jgi:hypothetical protein